MMVGFRAMGPAPIDVPTGSRTRRNGRRPRPAIRERFERIGFQIMNQSPAGGWTEPVPGNAR